MLYNAIARRCDYSYGGSPGPMELNWGDIKVNHSVGFGKINSFQINNVGPEQ